MRLSRTGARLGYGGTVTHAAAWACRQPAGPITSWTGTSTDGTTYRGTESHYRFDGTRLALTGTRPRTVTPTAPAPSGCGSLVLR